MSERLDRIEHLINSYALMLSANSIDIDEYDGAIVHVNPEAFIAFLRETGKADEVRVVWRTTYRPSEYKYISRARGLDTMIFRYWLILDNCIITTRVKVEKKKEAGEEEAGEDLEVLEVEEGASKDDGSIW